MHILSIETKQFLVLKNEAGDWMLKWLISTVRLVPWLVHRLVPRLVSRLVLRVFPPSGEFSPSQLSDLV